MRVYYGSIAIIIHPVVAAGRGNLDFGRGFYVTDIQSQAFSNSYIVDDINQEICGK